jgi:pyrophosphate--fructose-6-phosphate 1-phosphotransferase
MSQFLKLSPLQSHRLNFKPRLPPILHDLKNLVPKVCKQDICHPVNASINELFPQTIKMPFLSFKKGERILTRPLRVGVVFSGGQAPGGHNVISGVYDALNELHPDCRLFGFLDGPSGIIRNKSVELTEEMIAPYRNQGGFDLIGSGRDKFETLDQFEAAEKTIKALKLDGLIIIGGDDSNTNAAHLAEYFKKKDLRVCIAGVPKTIDGDLKNSFIEISFGFDTACKIYSEIIGNLAKDALSAKKYYFFVKLMGRSASHITLECALATQINLALIGEEIQDRKQSLKSLINQIADMICARASQDKNYGVILIPEGIIEFLEDFKTLIDDLNRIAHFEQEFSEKSGTQQIEFIQSRLNESVLGCYLCLPDEIKKQLLLERDPHGNIQVSKIETERLIINLVEKELKMRKESGIYTGKFNPQAIFCGYEGRTGLPSNFDCQYCYALGHAAALLIHSGVSGYMGCLRNVNEKIEKWEIQGVPLAKMLNMEKRNGKNTAVLQKSLVNLDGEVFKSYQRQRLRWQIEDHYLCPGPIQFDGPSSLTNMPPITLLLEKKPKKKPCKKLLKSTL